MAEQHSSEADKYKTIMKISGSWQEDILFSQTTKSWKDNSKSNKLPVRPYLLSVPVISYENINFFLLRQAHSVYYTFLIVYSFPYLHVLSSQRLLWLITDRVTPNVFTKLILYCNKV